MIEHLFPLHALKIMAFAFVALVLAILSCLGLLWATKRGSDKRPWKAAILVCVVVFLSVLVSGCAEPINPVKYQTVEVLVTRPCFAGRAPPSAAAQLTEPVCAGSDAECVRAAKADILELQREAREFRNLFKECSK